MYKDIIILINSDSKYNKLIIYKNSKLMIEEIIENISIISLKKDTSYKIELYSNNNNIKTSIYVTDKYNYPYIFNLCKKNVFHRIFIKLLDCNYKGLKLDKGEVKLWIKNIT